MGLLRSEAQAAILAARDRIDAGTHDYHVVDTGVIGPDTWGYSVP